jgi:hypothetical protein
VLDLPDLEARLAEVLAARGQAGAREPSRAESGPAGPYTTTHRFAGVVGALPC